MIAQALKKSFDRYYEAPLEVWEYFANLCELVSCKKMNGSKSLTKQITFGYFVLEGAQQCLH